jgi:glycosyltransferase involved in cell wall biosynthesis
MRICLFTPTFLPVIGGAELFSDMFARGMIARGHHVLVIAQKMKSLRALCDLPYPVVLYRRPPMQHLWAEFLARPLVRAWRKQPFDLVVTNYGYPLAYAASRWKEKLKFGLISVAHGSDLHESFNFKNKFRVNHLRHLGYARSDHVIGVSGEMARRAREVIGDALTPVDVIHNGIDLETWRREQNRARFATAPVAGEFSLRSGAFTLQVAALRPVKRPDVAIRAVALCRDVYEQFDLKHVMVGEGKLAAECKRLANELGVGDRVVFTGSRIGEDKQWLFAHARLFVHSSDEEGGLPFVLSEAAASGLPLLVSEIATHLDFLSDSKCGFTFRKGDAQNLSAGLRSVLEMDTTAMRAAALIRSKDFAWSKTLDAYEKILLETVRLVRTSPGRCASPLR